MGKPLGAFSLTGLLALVFGSSADETVGWLTLAAVVLAIAFSAWLFASAVLYLYVSLSGGVMDPEATRDATATTRLPPPLVGVRGRVHQDV